MIHFLWLIELMIVAPFEQCFEIYWYNMPLKYKILSNLAIEMQR